MERPKYEVLRRPDGMPDYQASAMKYYADTLLYLDEKHSGDKYADIHKHVIKSLSMDGVKF